jgi:hypothetical protein
MALKDAFPKYRGTLCYKKVRTPRRDIAGEFFRCVTEKFELTFDRLVAICNDGFPSKWERRQSTSLHYPPPANRGSSVGLGTKLQAGRCWL